MLSKNGQLIVISAPSGAGKTSAIKSVIRELNNQNKESKFSVSHTTRSPREGDTDGSDYFFVTDKVFDELSESGTCLLYTSPSPRDRQKSRMPSSA